MIKPDELPVIYEYARNRQFTLSMEVDELDRQLKNLQRDIHAKRIELKFIQEVLNTEHE